MCRRLPWMGMVVVAMVLVAPVCAIAQDTAEAEEGDETEGEAPDDTVSDVIFVTGSRISNPLSQRAPLVEIDTLALERTGQTNIGTALQQLPSTGSAINTRFNVPGNSGFPQDGNGIGAGAIQLALRNLGAKRTLVLVDGKRWIAGASASGVPVAVDLNTVPANMIERIEVLQDGASAIYGSDAIGGVVNIITKQYFKGMQIGLQTGQYLSDGDGSSSELTALWGGGDDRTHFMVSASYYDEGDIETADRAQSAFPTPFGTSCLDGGCSSFTPQARIVLGPELGGRDLTTSPGTTATPSESDFRDFTTADRFNFNGPGFNFLLTPNERLNIFASVARQLTDQARLLVKASYTNRKSTTMGAPEPLCLGAGCGNRINEEMVIHRDNPFNPFGVDLSVADGTMDFFARRPLESGPRIFDQDVDTYFTTVGLDGTFESGSRSFYWEAAASYGENRGFQQKQNSHNAAKLAIALGDPDVCAQVPNCVPFNFFGGQGPNGTGSITEEMLDFVRFVQRDFSEQTLLDITANITGDLAELPNGNNVAFAAGVEYRDHDGSFQPDPIAASGETAGIPSAPTAGGFDVTEVYAEVNLPLLSGAGSAKYLEVNLAGRYSDYSTFGGETTYKIGSLWQPTEQVSLRASFSTGIRAPGIGELFGGAAREDFTFLDPCADVLGVIGSANGGRDTPQPQNIIDNCAALGVPTNFAQRNPQLSAVSAGNAQLVPETSDNYSLGVVFSPGKWSVSLDYYDLEIDDAVQGRDPGDVITACVDTLDPFFCDAIERSASGGINLVDNQLQNIGGVEASGFDLAFNWAENYGFGQLAVGVSATQLDDYIELTKNADGSLSSVDRTGTITNETFQRAFPEWRGLGTVDWSRDRYGAGVSLRWVDSMTQTSGNELSSRVFIDAQFRYSFPFSNDNATFSVGINNLLDESPSTCDSCGVIGMSPVVHDLPGTVGYARLTLDFE